MSLRRGFPPRNAGRASCHINSSQYFTLLIFAPIYGWIIHVAGLEELFLVYRPLFGVALAVIWFYLLLWRQATSGI